MISKNQIKHIISLQQKKRREQERLFIIEGEKMLIELFNSSFVVHSVYGVEEWVEKHSLILDEHKIAINTVTDIELSKISALSTPQQVLALAAMREYKMELNGLKGKLTLMLDVKDPGNLGTIIRIADWFGIKNIICSENSVELYNPKVVQATMGSLFRVNVFYTDIVSLLSDNKSNLKLPVYAATMKGTSLYDASLSKEGLVILGNESEGVGKELMDYVDHALTIPSFAEGKRHPDSLNVAVAAAIVCSEFRRRK